MGWGNTDCCISPGQHYAFKGSTGVLGQCFGALNWLEGNTNHVSWGFLVGITNHGEERKILFDAINCVRSIKLLVPTMF